MQSVQRALREIGSAGCIAAAQELGQASAQSSSINIHLRRAEIDDGGAALIARALKAVPNGERAKLRSFSLSYNKIGDRGALAIAGALPQTLTELGLVGCSIGDNGGQAVLHWAQQAAGLSMICIEDNTMSAQMQDSFRTLRNASRRVAVFV